MVFHALLWYFLEYQATDGIPRMGAKAVRLTEAKLKNAAPKASDYVLGDGDGLQMRVRSNGSKLWNFNYYHPVTKKRINMGLGAYPETSLAQARKLTVDARQLIAQGLDPNAPPASTP